MRGSGYEEDGDLALEEPRFQGTRRSKLGLPEAFFSGVRARRVIEAAGLQVGCYLVSLAAFLIGRDSLHLPPDRDPQIVFVVAASMLFALAGGFFRTRVLIWLLIARLGGVLFLAQALGAAAGVVVFAFLPLVTDYFAAYRWPLGACMTAASLAAGLAAMAPHQAWGAPTSSAGAQELLFVGSSALTAALAATIRSQRGRIERQAAEADRMNEAIRRLTDANVEYQNHATFVREESMEIERHRITREIHDIVGYTMTNMLMIVQAALYSDANDRARVRQLLSDAQTHINESIQDARRALHRLRDQGERRPVGANLFLRLTRTFQSITGVAVRVEFGNLPTALPERAERAIYRLLQECMTNAFRHGRATEITVRFWCEGDRVSVVVSDNGSGLSSPLTEGIGIQGMRERVAQIGGSLRAGPTAGGFSVQAGFPLREDSYGKNTPALGG